MLEVSWQKITREEALQIASEYWEIEDGFTDYGAGSMWICRIMILDPPSSAWGYYHIGLQTDHYGRDENDLRVHIESRMEHIFVDSVTGECQDYAPIYISRSEAITLAEKYWEHFDIKKTDISFKLVLTSMPLISLCPSYSPACDRSLFDI